MICHLHKSDHSGAIALKDILDDLRQVETAEDGSGIIGKYWFFYSSSVAFERDFLAVLRVTMNVGNMDFEPLFQNVQEKQELILQTLEHSNGHQKIEIQAKKLSTGSEESPAVVWKSYVGLNRKLNSKSFGFLLRF